MLKNAEKMLKTVLKNAENDEKNAEKNGENVPGRERLLARITS